MPNKSDCPGTFFPPPLYDDTCKAEEKKLLIGFDPDVKGIGFAVLDATVGEFKTIRNLSLMEIIPAIEALQIQFGKFDVTVEAYLEDLSKNPATFGAYRQFTKIRHSLKWKRNAGAEENAFSVAAKRIEKTARCSEISNIIKQFLIDEGITVKTVAPGQRQRANEKPLSNIAAEELADAILAKYRKENKRVLLSKLDAKRFNIITGWTKRTNEDSRDAAGLLIPDYLKIKNG